MTVTENTLRLNKALAAVKAHCMCFRFFEDSTHYTVHYPAGMFPDGCRASLGMGRAKALEKMLEVMERHWNENGIHGGGLKNDRENLAIPRPAPAW